MKSAEAVPRYHRFFNATSAREGVAPKDGGFMASISGKHTKNDGKSPCFSW